MIGKSISHYTILEKLGAGGMGVVYKAEDTRLNRTVALKFLPRELTSDTDARKRFMHEARAASALNHPNVATIYEIDQADGQTSQEPAMMFIVMEYIEGWSLKRLILPEPPLQKGATGHHPPLEKGDRGGLLSIENCLNYAIQIAEGLAKAHSKEIIHRDIKPANLLVTEDGVVKIVDFGLAKLAGRTMLTKEGTTMGTVAYMSPEQTQGVDVDHRTDIWALGVVLYEMLTGEQPFKGDYEQAVIYSILNEEPDLSGIPEALIPVMQKALAKQAEERYQNVGEMLTDLKAVTGSHPLSGLDAKGTSGKKQVPSRKIPLLMGSLALVVLTVAAIGYFLSTRGYSNLKIISTRPITSTPGFEGQPTWSPDGTRIAYTSDESGRQDIWVRQLGAGQSINLTKGQPGSKNTAPAWSPDGEWIAFSSDREQKGLYVIPSLGGNARQVLASGETEIDAVSWSPDASKLVFVTSKVYFSANAIYTVSVKSGEKTQVPFQLKGQNLQDPAWSPDGERLAIVESMGTGTTTSRILTIKLDGSDPHPVTDATSFNNKPVWSADGKRILFVSDRGGSSDIWWVPIDANGGVIGPAKALTTGVGVGAIALSRDGKKLAYEKILQTSSIWSMPMTQKGLLTLEDAKLISAGNDLIEKAEISPDGRWLAFDSNRAGNTDIWIMKPDGSDLRQVTTDLAHDWAPTWSPDSKRIAFHSLRSGNRDIWVKPIAGGAAKQLTTDPSKDWDARWSPKSADIAFTSYRGGGANIWIVSENSAPRQLTFQKSKEVEAGAWSPQGNMIAFISLQTGKEELYLIWTKTGKTEQLTANDFRNITPFAWARDGTTIYFLAVKESETTGNIYAISTTDGAIRKLTDFPNDPSKFLNWVTSDGERFYLVFNEHKSDIWVVELAEEK